MLGAEAVDFSVLVHVVHLGIAGASAPPHGAQKGDREHVREESDRDNEGELVKGFVVEGGD